MHREAMAPVKVARPAWMHGTESWQNSRRRYIAAHTCLLLLLLSSVYACLYLPSLPTLPSLTSNSFEAMVNRFGATLRGHDDMPWETMGAVDPHIQPERPHDITAPATIKPYYQQARRARELGQGDVTLFATATVDRLDMVEMVAMQYQGPISLAFWLPATDSDARTFGLAALGDLVARSQAVKNWVDVHLVIEDRQLELNRWRNVARRYARTDYVMMYDIDFWLPAGFRARLAEPKLQAALKEGKQAFAVPCFIAHDDELAVQPHRYPGTKAQLLELTKTGKFDMPNPHWPVGHGSTDYPHWYTVDEESTDYYKIASPHPPEYEPYFIFNTHHAPYCTEVFTQWSEKAACVYEMHIAGLDMRVMPGAFLLHVGIKGPATRTGKQKWSEGEAENWRREICHRYLGYFSKYQQLDQPISTQFRQMCMAYPGMRDLEFQMLQAGEEALHEGATLR